MKKILNSILKTKIGTPLTLLPIAFLLLSISFGCKKTETINIEKSQPQKEPNLTLKDVKTENGYFVFIDILHFLNSMRELNTKSYQSLMDWYASQKNVEILQFEYNKMLKSYELMADETDPQKVKSFITKYSDIATFEEDGTVSINAPVEYAQIVNKKGLVKIGTTLIACNQKRSVQILDGDVSRVNEYLEMPQIESNANVIITDKIGTKLQVRGTCAGEAFTSITISDLSNQVTEFPGTTGNLKYRADTKLIIENWAFGSNRFAQLFATTKSYKRGFLGRWYSTSVNKTCSGTIVFDTDATCAERDIATGECLVPVTPTVISGYSDSISERSEFTFPIIGPYSFYIHYAGALKYGATFAQSCSDLTLTNFFQNNSITQTIQ